MLNIELSCTALFESHVRTVVAVQVEHDTVDEHVIYNGYSSTTLLVKLEV